MSVALFLIIINLEVVQMLTFRFLFSAMLKVWFLTLGAMAFAQSEPGQWVDDLYLVNLMSEPLYEKILIDEVVAKPQVSEE